MTAGSITATLLAAALAIGPASARTIIHAGTLIASPGKAPEQRQTLIVQQGRVLAIEAGFVEPEAGDHWIDLSCCVVLPGFIDLHVHLTSPAQSDSRLRAVTETSADLALLAADYGRLTLEAGFTTVLDLGTGRRAHAEAIFAYRAATAAHRLPGPRVLAVGSPISPTGLSRTGRFRADVEAVIGPEGVCDGPDDCRRAVREQVKWGADLISFYDTGSLLDKHIVEQTFTDAEMTAIVETAHALGRRVVADGHTALGVNAALRAGADIVDTVPWPDGETWRLLKKTGAYFVPHLYAFEVSTAGMDDADNAPQWLPDHILQRLLDIKREPYSAELAHRRGIPIAFGSDTGVVDHGDNAGEFGELVKAGLAPMEAIMTATVNAASALGLENEIGSLRPGLAADVIAVDGDPLRDIEELRDVVFVMRGGVVYKHRP